MSDRMQEQLKSMGNLLLEQKATIRKQEQLLERIGDDLVAAGNTPDAFREYYPGYLSPDERRAIDKAHMDAAPKSAIGR